MKRSFLQPKDSAFSLLEMLVAVSILSFLMGILILALSQTQTAWVRTVERSEQFREARIGLDILSRRLEAATLNSYWGYDDINAPKEYEKKSELHFASGPSEVLMGGGRFQCGHAVFFQAPFGYGGSDAGQLGGGPEYSDMPGLLNCWGYYVEFGSDIDPARGTRPNFLAADTAHHPERKRFRLVEYRLPAERLPLFIDGYSGSRKIGELTDRDAIYSWFGDGAERIQYSTTIAENVLAVFLRSRVSANASAAGVASSFSIADGYHFDSRRYQWDSGSSVSKVSKHRVPPVIDVRLVALDGSSWNRYYDRKGDSGASELIQIVNALVKSPESMEQDILTLEKELSKRQIKSRVFNTSIAMRSGKWVE